jgi:murein DD-endopeptidase MepM/ murein hydrolase activator NlpD
LLWGALAVVVATVVAIGTMVERQTPAAGRVPSGSGWTQAAPESTTSATAPAGATATAKQAATANPTVTRKYVFPVNSSKATYEHAHHDYPATDIIAPCGSPVLAVTDGVVLEVSRSDTYDARADDGALRGGLFVSILGDDGVRYYGSHFKSLSAQTNPQVRVKAGDTIGLVGESGDAGACHLHFGLSPSCAGLADWWIRRGVIWPWSYLDSWKRGEPKSPAAEIVAWNKANGCPGAPT